MTLVYKLFWWKYDADGAFVDSGNDKVWNESKDWVDTHRHCFERRHPGYQTNVVSIDGKVPTTWGTEKYTINHAISWADPIYE